MNTYKIFDIVINSDIELPILPASESSEYDLKLSVVSRSPISKDFNVYHRINFSGKPWVSFLKSSDAFAIRFHTVATVPVPTAVR